jgi:homoserine kinase type II
MLAHLHNVARSLPDQGYRTYHLAWDPNRWLVRLQRIEHAILSHQHPNLTDQWALARVRAQQQWLTDPDCLHSFTPMASAQVIHGDYHDANLFFNAEGVSGIIDWEQAAYVPRAFEVVRAATYMFNLQPELTLAFLRAYCTSSDLGPEELAEGAIAWGMMNDHYVWAPEEVYLNGNDRARRFIPHRPFRPFQQLWSALRLEQTLFAPK